MKIPSPHFWFSPQHRTVFVALIVASIGVPLATTAPLGAQADTLSSAVAALQPAQRVRLDLHGQEEPLVGHLATDDVPWILRAENEQQTVQRDEIQRLWAEVGDHAGEGLLYGILAGAGAGAVIGAVAVEATNSRGFSRGGGAFVGALVGFFPGLFTGVAIGANTPKWELRYSSEPQGVAVSIAVP